MANLVGVLTGVVCRGADEQSEKEHGAADFERVVAAALLLGMSMARRLGLVMVLRLRRGSNLMRLG